MRPEAAPLSGAPTPEVKATPAPQPRSPPGRAAPQGTAREERGGKEKEGEERRGAERPGRGSRRLTAAPAEGSARRPSPFPRSPGSRPPPPPPS